MNFWESELGEITGNTNDAFAKTFTQIPDSTMALAKIDTFINVEYQGFKYLLIEWLLTDGDFKGQKVQQKLKVFGGDSYDKDSLKTRHRALNMLKLLYQLFNIKPKHATAPSDQDLSIFIGKIAGIKIRETEPNDKGKQYNWISEVHDAKGFKSETGISIIVSHINMHPNKEPIDSAFNRQSQLPTDMSLEDDIPF